MKSRQKRERDTFQYERGRQESLLVRIRSQKRQLLPLSFLFFSAPPINHSVRKFSKPVSVRSMEGFREREEKKRSLIKRGTQKEKVSSEGGKPTLFIQKVYAFDMEITQKQTIEFTISNKQLRAPLYLVISLPLLSLFLSHRTKNILDNSTFLNSCSQSSAKFRLANQISSLLPP